MKTTLILLALFVTGVLLSSESDALKVRTATLNTYGMHCTGCEETVQAEITKLDGIKSVKADHVNKTVTVQYDDKKVTLDQVKAAIVNAGYRLEE